MTQKEDILQLPISFKNIRLIRLNLPQKEQFVSGIGVRNSREALIIEWEDIHGVKGYGECSCRPDPYYSDEFIEGAIALVDQFIVPFLVTNQTFGDLLKLLDKIRGWNFTKAAVEMAALQVIEKNTGKSPFELLQNKPLDHVPVGISLGLYTELDRMKKVVKNALETGYKRLKFKISPNVRIDFFEEINPMLFAADTYVSFDANGSFGENDLEIFNYFANTYQSMIEQPFAPNRFDVLLKAKKENPDVYICYDEEIKSIGDLMKLHHLGLLDEVNLKVGRVGGVMKSIEIIQYCAEHNIPCWIGGMFETGIGRTLNLRMASYLPNARAHDLSPSDRYFLEDIVQPNIEMNNGMVAMQSLQNCEIQSNLIDKYTIDQKTLEATC
ncbi:o-succinylbenzoate synthase [Kordia sp. YSTF-M3]|uniref:o-succinylbenzoate synthase n=1 Tax=Kordia aestuariivivens TaxID=2759037 RepID=A0ABR7Q7U9_9FLAO|nr:o-succinylbenzoate synthase [Kordia aestuariivivens]MBC8754644.1 o-succinylbenzoate synthase [Kordia aestuariivivens]